MGHALEPGVPIRMEELLRHADWLRRLAASLVADPGRADDLVQDTWLAALRRPPRAGAPARPWLERVFRNLARNRRRDERTRADHEPRAGGPRPSPGPGEIAAEVEAQRVLAEAVGRLSDPARTIVVLRYFRGLDASAIGRELDLPPGTVRWRLKAALDELRHELDHRFEGGRKAWSLALARVLATAAPPAVAVSMGWLGAAAAVVMVGIAGWWGVRREALTAGEPARSSSAQLVAESPRAEALHPAPAAVDPGAAVVLPRRARAPIEGSAARRTRYGDGTDIAGRVLVDGAPPQRSIDLELDLSGSGSRTLATDEDGLFTAFARGSDVEFTLRAPGFLTEHAGPDWTVPRFVTPATNLVLHLRTPPAIRGRVVASGGEPVPRAHGVYELHAETAEMGLFSGRGELDCDGEGRFELTLLDLMSEGMPKLRADETWQGTLLFEVPRVGRSLLDLGPAVPVDLELGDLVLEPARVVVFTVRDEHGVPLSGAVARLDDSWLAVPSSPTNREGRGELRHAPDRSVRVRFSALGYEDHVLVVEPGEQPAVWLEPSAQLEVQLEPPANTYGPFPDLKLIAAGELFEPDDAPRPEAFVAMNAIQAELGASATDGHGRKKDKGGLRVFAWFHPDPGGRVLVTGLSANVALAVEARDASGHVLARRELVLAPGERRRLALPYGE